MELLVCARSEKRLRRRIKFLFSNSARYFWAWRFPTPISCPRLSTAGKHLPSWPAYRAKRPYAIFAPGDTSLDWTRASGIKIPVKSRNGLNGWPTRSEEHTSELQSLRHLVCRLLLE